MRRGWVVLGLLAALGTPLIAEDAPARKLLMTGEDSAGWTAVGRINIGPGSFCTGALIDARLVLTAAHCMFDLESGARLQDSEIEFLADWRGGRATAERRVRRSIVHPKFVLEEATFVDRVAYDVALLELAEPIQNASITPFEVRHQHYPGTEVRLVSYAHDRANSPGLQDLCHIIGRQSGSYVMSCDVDFGSSGAPIFSFDSGRPEIVSVVSAKAKVDDRRVALGSSLTAPLADLMEMIAAGPRFELPGSASAPHLDGRPPVRRLAAQRASESATGAKFMRP